MQKVVFVIFLLGFSFELFSQQISVVSFERLDHDLDARVNFPIKDQNGDVCALIKVETTQTGFFFDGGQLGITKTERKTGEYWVYIPWGSKRITIMHDQLGVLRDYAFPEKIDKATVYIMKLSTGKVTTIVEEPEILKQWLVISSTPDNAYVYINDKPVGSTPFSDEFLLGEYNYRIEMPMYHTDAGKLNLDGNTDKYRIESVLKPNFGSISVNSTPETGADVLLDGKPTGKKTPCTLTEVSSENHRISIKKVMYHDAWQDIKVEDDKTANLSLNMKAAFGEIEISTNPSADIYIDGAKVGSGTYSVRKSSGVYAIEARKERHIADKKNIDISDGQIIAVNLAPTPQYGILKVNSSPPDAEIYINDEKLGTTPSTLRQLLIGEHKLELKLKNYPNYITKIKVQHNETIEINHTFQLAQQVNINSNPAGAIIEIDSEPAGTTPYTGYLNFGNHELKLSNNDKTINQSITVSQGGKTNWNFDMSSSKTNILSIKDNKKIKNPKFILNTGLYLTPVKDPHEIGFVDNCFGYNFKLGYFISRFGVYSFFQNKINRFTYNYASYNKEEFSLISDNYYLEPWGNNDHLFSKYTLGGLGAMYNFNNIILYSGLGYGIFSYCSGNNLYSYDTHSFEYSIIFEEKFYKGLGFDVGMIFYYKFIGLQLGLNSMGLQNINFNLGISLLY